CSLGWPLESPGVVTPFDLRPASATSGTRPGANGMSSLRNGLSLTWRAQRSSRLAKPLVSTGSAYNPVWSAPPARSIAPPSSQRRWYVLGGDALAQQQLSSRLFDLQHHGAL